MTDAVDLRQLLTEKASRPAASVSVPLAQGIRKEITDLEEQISSAAAHPRRMGKSSAKGLAERIRELEQRAADSVVTFRFEALTHAQREEIRVAMGGRDDPDEVNLRAIAAMCVTPACTWEDLRDLRDAIGVRIFEETIDAAATRASGGDWSVPFSLAASAILETLR